MSSPPRKPSPIAEPRIGADRALALTYVPAVRKPAIEALWAIDAAMADVVSSTRQPMVGQIRLAWWRERLEELGTVAAPAEPRLQAVQRDLLSRGIEGAEVAALEIGWAALLEDFPWGLPTVDAVRIRGRILFAIGGVVLGADSDDLRAAGGLWALVDCARHCSDGESRRVLLREARLLADRVESVRYPAVARPLSMLAALAIADLRTAAAFEPEGTPKRAVRMLAHRLTGRMPRLG